MNVFLLLERAKEKLEEGEPYFTEATHTITCNSENPRSNPSQEDQH
jgi:hypothetical protein